VASGDVHDIRNSAIAGHPCPDLSGKGFEEKIRGKSYGKEEKI
jgi:hypothetical protein